MCNVVGERARGRVWGVGARAAQAFSPVGHAIRACPSPPASPVDRRLRVLRGDVHLWDNLHVHHGHLHQEQLRVSAHRASASARARVVRTAIWGHSTHDALAPRTHAGTSGSGTSRSMGGAHQRRSRSAWQPRTASSRVPSTLASRSWRCAACSSTAPEPSAHEQLGCPTAWGGVDSPTAAGRGWPCTWGTAMHTAVERRQPCTAGTGWRIGAGHQAHAVGHDGVMASKWAGAGVPSHDGVALQGIPLGQARIGLALH